MSFLKKLGMVLAQVGATAVGIGPIITPLFGSSSSKAAQTFSTVTNDLTTIASLIVQVEVALQGKAGPEKFQAALNLVGPIIKTSQLVSGKKIADETLLQKGITEVTQGVVDVLNSLHQESVNKEVKTS
jgi:hypothetical protein